MPATRPMASADMGWTKPEAWVTVASPADRAGDCAEGGGLAILQATRR